MTKSVGWDLLRITVWVGLGLITAPVLFSLGQGVKRVLRGIGR